MEVPLKTADHSDDGEFVGDDLIAADGDTLQYARIEEMPVSTRAGDDARG